MAKLSPLHAITSCISHITEVGEFDHVAPRIQHLVDQIQEEAEEDEDLNHPEELIAKLIQKINSKSALNLEQTFGGVACGPTWMTVYLGIDFSSGIEIEER